MPGLAENVARRAKGTMLDHVGLRIVEVNDQHAVSTMDFRPELSQPTGLFHAGALLTLADSTATLACMQAVDPSGSDGAAPFPLAVQISMNLIRNTGAGSVTAESVLRHRGRTMLVAETTLRDDRGRDLAIVISTHLVLAGAAGSAAPERS
jgi:1,4-dihydroxy-2-naphthoyl-CoA hydrolase